MLSGNRSSYSGSSASGPVIIDLIDDSDDDGRFPAPAARFGSTPQSAFFSRHPARRATYTGRMDNEDVIDLISDDEAPPPPPPPPPRQSAFGNQASISNAPIQSTSGASSSASLSTPRAAPALPVVAPKSTPASAPPAKKRRLTIKEEFPPKAFGEANIGDELVEMAPEEEEVAASGMHGSGGDEDFEIVGGNLTVAAEMPHQREACTRFPFMMNGKAGTPMGAKNLTHCPQCYCYVCEVKADECTEWSVHCNATYRLQLWKDLHKVKSAPIMRIMNAAQRVLFAQEAESFFSNDSDGEGYNSYDEEDDDEYNSDYDEYNPYRNRFRDEYGRGASNFQSLVTKMQAMFQRAQDEDSFVAAAALLVQLIEKNAQAYNIRSLENVILECSINKYCKNGLVDLLKTTLTNCNLHETSQLVSCLQSFLANPSGHYPKCPNRFWGLSESVCSTLLKRVYSRMENRLLDDWLMHLKFPSMPIRVLFCIAEEFAELPGLDKMKMITEKVAALGQRVNPTTFPAIAAEFIRDMKPVVILRFLAVILDMHKASLAAIPSAVVSCFVGAMLQVALRGMTVASAEEVFAAVTAEGTVIQRRLSDLSVFDWIVRQTGPVTAHLNEPVLSSAGMALTLLWVHLIRLCATPGFPAMENFFNFSIDGLEIRLVVIVSNFLAAVATFANPNEIMDVSCKVATRAMINESYDAHSHRISGIVLNELLRLPTIACPQSVGNTIYGFMGLQCFEVNTHSTLPGADAVVNQDHKSFSDALKAIVLPDTAVMVQQSKKMLGSFLNTNQLSTVWTRMSSQIAVSGKASTCADKLNYFQQHSDTLRILWKALILHLLQLQSTPSSSAQPSLLRLDSGASILSDDLIEATLQPAFVAEHGSSTFVVLHGLKVISKIGAGVRTSPFDLYSTMKQTIHKIYHFVEANPQSIAELRHLYLLEEGANEAESICDIWNASAVKRMNGVFETYGNVPSIRLAFALAKEDFTMVDYCLLQNTVALFTTLTKISVDSLVWRPAVFESHFRKLTNAFEQAVIKLTMGDPAGEIAKMSAALMNETLDNVLMNVFARLSIAFVATFADFRLPLLRARIPVFLSNQAVDFATRGKLEQIRLSVGQQVKAGVSPTDFPALVCSCAYTGQFVEVLAAHGDDVHQVAALFKFNSVGTLPTGVSFKQLVRWLIVFCPDQTLDLLLGQLMPIFCNHEDNELDKSCADAIKQSIDRERNRPGISLRYRLEALFYFSGQSSDLNNLLHAVPNDPFLVINLIIWLKGVKNPQWKGHLPTLRQLMTEDEFNDYLFSVRPAESAGAQTKDLATAVKGLLTTLNSRDSALCALAYCLLRNKALIADDLLADLQASWLVSVVPAQLSTSRAKEIEFCKIFLQMLRDSANALPYLQRLRSFDEMYAQHRQAVVSIFNDPSNVPRSLQFQLQICEFRGMTAFLRDIIFDGNKSMILHDARGVTAIDTLTGLINKKTLISYGNTSFPSTEPIGVQCVKVLAHAEGFLRVIFELIVMIQGYFFECTHELRTRYGAALQKLVGRIVAFAEKQSFVDNYLSSALSLMSTFNSATFHSLPADLQAPLSSCSVEDISSAGQNKPTSLLIEMFIISCTHSNTSARMHILEQVLSQHLKGALGCMNVDKASPAFAQLVGALLRKVFFQPCFTLGHHSQRLPLPNAFGTPNSAASGMVVNKLKALIRKFKAPAAELLQESILMCLLGQNINEASLNILNLEFNTFKSAVKVNLSKVMMFDGNWQQLCKEMAALSAQVKYFAHFALPQPSMVLVSSLTEFDTLRQKPFFDTWKQLMKMLVVQFLATYTAYQGTDAAGLYKVLARSYSAAAAGLGHLLSPAEADKILQLFPRDWVLGVAPSSQLPLADIASVPKLLASMTTDVVPYLADLQAHYLLQHWQQLLTSAAPDHKQAVLKAILESFVNVAAAQQSKTVNASRRNRLEQFVASLRAVITPYKTQYNALITDAVNRAAKMVKSKPKVAQIFRALLV